MTKLVIVESPSKAKTIANYLGKEYTVIASVGHIRDLPKKLGVNIIKNFQEEYVVLPNKIKIVTHLKNIAKKATEIILATDPDREGEAISWHLLQEIQPSKTTIVSRALFNEITPSGIAKGMSNTTTINHNLVDAQRARRVLDRLVGYNISQILWDKIRCGLSAGRVQSVTVRLIKDREEEIISFNPHEYWIINCIFSVNSLLQFNMKLIKLAGTELQLGNKEQEEKIMSITTKSKAEELKKMIHKANWKITSIVTKENKRQPPTPFNTSKLQQEASQKLHMNVARTMQNAQRLYEGIDFGEGLVGLITYIRTDSTRLSIEAIKNIQDYIKKRFGNEYILDRTQTTQNAKNIQNAHEAIRPTNIYYTPDRLKNYLQPDHLKLYTLIWQRTLASQMNAMLLDKTIVESTAMLSNNEEAVFQTKDHITKFQGWHIVYSSKDGCVTQDDNTKIDIKNNTLNYTKLTSLQLNQTLNIEQVDIAQFFTKPPTRFSEATLVKELEEDGIGRPSTYASIISTIQDRNYVVKDNGRFKPTELGCLVTDLLVQDFNEIMDPSYTSALENELDQIEEGKMTFVNAMQNFYIPFKKLLVHASTNMDNLKIGVSTTKQCKECNANMLKRIGKNGIFFGCSQYPKCNYTEETKELPTFQSLVQCPLCKISSMMLRKGKFGFFWTCSNYPDCRGTRKADESGMPMPDDVILNELCTVCGKHYVKRHGRYGEFTCCIDYPKCKTVKKDILPVPCPTCGGNISQKTTKTGKIFYGCTDYPNCKFTTWNKPILQSCPSCNNNYTIETISKQLNNEKKTILKCPICNKE